MMGQKKASAAGKLKPVRAAKPVASVQKCPTGIRGFDEITFGGVPQARSTLVTGGAGCGKTLFGLEFLVRGALEFGENGVCISFEETAAELAANTESLGYYLAELIKKKKIAVDYIYIERGQVEETGEFDLEALFLRIDYAVRSVGAKRVVLDGVEALFAGLTNRLVLRAELRRLFRWLKSRNLTSVITGEEGETTLTRQGLEEYISDCVVLLDHRVWESILTRNLRVVKYRGSLHGTNEYPFLIESDGISVLPVTSIGLDYPASEQRIPSGVLELDAMLGGKGYYRGSSILISGPAGTGKTSLAAHFLNAACGRGERSLYLSFEESPSQIIRDVRSIGVDLQRWVDKGLLHFQSSRPTMFGLEMHLAQIHRIVEDFDPANVVVDPITSLLHSGTVIETSSMLLRLIDFLKAKSITAMMTTVTSRGADVAEQSGTTISSLIDAWLLLRDIEMGGERNRGLYVLKARGIAHSNQIREFLLTKRGIELRDVYLGEAGLLTGSARVTQEARDKLAALNRQQEIDRKKWLLERKRRVLESQIASLQMDMESDALEVHQLEVQTRQTLAKLAQDRAEMATSRLAGRTLHPPNGRAAASNGGRR